MDNTSDAGAVLSAFGFTFASLGSFDGHGGTDILVGQGALSSPGNGPVLFSYDSDTDMFIRRVHFKGDAGLGRSIVGIDNYLGNADGLPQIGITHKNTFGLYIIH